MPKIYYKQNILILNKEIILNKERISILDFSFSVSKMAKQQYDNPTAYVATLRSSKNLSLENTPNNMIFTPIFGCCEVSFLKWQVFLSKDILDFKLVFLYFFQEIWLNALPLG